MNNTQEQTQNDEIDLLELLKSLWANKILILAITAISCIAGIAYALLAPQLWSAKAVIVAPSPTQLVQLQLRLDNLVARMDITNDNRNTNDNGNTDDDSTFFESFSETKLYTDFIQSFNSFDNKCEFLKMNGSIGAEAKKDATTLQRTLEGMAKNISVHKKKKDEEFTTLSFSSANAQEAGKLLKEYLNFIQTKEMAAKNEILVDKITNQTNVLTLTYQILEKAAHKTLQDDIIRTQYALRISRTAGIEAPVENLNNQSMFAIDLGAKALSEKLNILKEIKSFELINPALANTRQHLDSIKAIPQKKVLFSSYHFLKSPSEPLRRDKPKRSLVVVLATFAGLLIGVMVALLRASSIFGDSKRC